MKFFTEKGKSAGEVKRKKANDESRKDILNLFFPINACIWLCFYCIILLANIVCRALQ
jgi:hypothetical protein